MASGRNAVVGFGRQVSEGSALTVPKFEIPMGEGMAGPERNVEELGWTAETQDAVGFYVSRVSGIVDMSLPVLFKSFPALAHAVLGARTTTGAAAPYKHDITPAEVLPWLTFFFAQPGGNYLTLPDTKLGSFELSGSSGSPLNMSVNGMSKGAITRAAAKWGAAAVVENPNAGDPFATMINAVINLDHSSSPATTRARNIRNYSITVNRNLDAIQTDGVGFEYVYEQKREVGLSFTDVVFENNDWINTVFFGSPSGTTLSSIVVNGSAELTFRGSDEAAAATRSITLGFPRVLYAIDRVPGADPDGSTLAYTVTGNVSKPLTGASITISTINGESGANY